MYVFYIHAFLNETEVQNLHEYSVACVYKLVESVIFVVFDQLSVGCTGVSLFLFLAILIKAKLLLTGGAYYRLAP